MAAVGNEARGFKWEREMARKLREDDVELRIGLAWSEQRWRDGSMVSSSSPAFGWHGQQRSEAWKWKKKRRMLPAAR
jgi:hypothetical protein